MNKTYLKLGIALLGLFYSFYYFSTVDQWHFIDNVNLIIHEAGHFIFMFFGHFLTIAGGTIMQLLVPIVFIGYFYFRREYFSASILGFWLAINFMNIAIYAADAVVMKLELLGGDSSGHDWHNMLQILGLLNHTQLIGNLFYGLGIITAVLSFAFVYINLEKKVQ